MVYRGERQATEMDRSTGARGPTGGQERMRVGSSGGGLLKERGSADSGYLHRPTPFSLARREGLWRDALLRRMLALADLAAVIAASAVLGLSADGRVHYALWSAVFAPTWLVLAKLNGLYDRD